MPRLNIWGWADTSETVQTIDIEEARQLDWEAGIYVVEGKLVLSFSELEGIISMPDYREKEALEVLVYKAIVGG